MRLSIAEKHRYEQISWWALKLEWVDNNRIRTMTRSSGYQLINPFLVSRGICKYIIIARSLATMKWRFFSWPSLSIYARCSASYPRSRYGKSLCCYRHLDTFETVSKQCLSSFSKNRLILVELFLLQARSKIPLNPIRRSRNLVQAYVRRNVIYQRR